MRGIADGTGACALSLTVVAVWLHWRPAASASARLHRRGVIVNLGANADGFLDGRLPCRWWDVFMEGLRWQAYASVA